MYGPAARASAQKRSPYGFVDNSYHLLSSGRGADRGIRHAATQEGRISQPGCSGTRSDLRLKGRVGPGLPHLRQSRRSGPPSAGALDRSTALWPRASSASAKGLLRGFSCFTVGMKCSADATRTNRLRVRSKKYAWAWATAATGTNSVFFSPTAFRVLMPSLKGCAWGNFTASTGPRLSLFACR